MPGQENESSEAPDTSKSEKQTKTNKPRLVNSLLFVLVIVLAGALAYLYNNKSDEISNLETKVTQLEDENKINDDLLLMLGMEAPGSTESTSLIPCLEDSSYTADVGKFSVSLDAPRAIIRNLDSGFEGGPITSLNIVTCITDETNVYDNYPQSEVSVLAHPASTSAELKTSYEAQLGGSLVADGTVTIDGVTANKFTFSGLFETTVVYFDNAGIGYQIELVDTDTFTNAILTDLTTDWSFTP